MAETRQVQRALRLRGLEIRPQALKAILSVLNREPDRATALDALANALKETISRSSSSSSSSPIVDEELVKQVVLQLSKDDQDEEFDSIQVLDAFSLPFATCNAHSATATGSGAFQVQQASPPLQGGAESKTNVLRNRLAFARQRVMRNDLFKQQPVSASSSSSSSALPIAGSVRLTPIEQLVAGGGKQADGNEEDDEGEDAGGATRLHHVLGVLVRLDDHRFWLEDGNGKLALDLSLDDMQTGPGFFTVGCVVIASGQLVNLKDDNDHDQHSHSHDAGSSSSPTQYVFRVHALVMPPKETRVETEQAHPGLGRRLLGLPVLSRKHEERMAQLELEADGTYFVILSDVHLDDAGSLSALRQVLEGFGGEEDASPPQLIVLMGNFSRRAFSLTGGSGSGGGGGGGGGVGSSHHAGGGFISAQEYGDLFERLADLVMECAPSLVNSERTRWVFVPGPRDPSLAPSAVLPRPSLPASIARRFTDRLPAPARVSFTTNPARVLFYQQELCLFRNDSLQQMRRHCVLQRTGAGAGAADEHLVRTICSQAHLLPALEAKPTYVPFCESALRLYPLPHLVVLADLDYEQYQWNNDGCVVMNPGSFAADGSFVVYLPAQEKIEFSRVTLTTTSKEEEDKEGVE